VQLLRMEEGYVEGRIEASRVRVRLRQTRTPRGGAHEGAWKDVVIPWQAKVFAHGDYDLLASLARSSADSARARALREHLQDAAHAQRVSTLTDDDLSVPPSAGAVSRAGQHELARGASTAPSCERLPAKVGLPNDGQSMAIAIDNHLATLIRVAPDGKRVFSRPSLGKEFLLSISDGAEYSVCMILEHNPNIDSESTYRDGEPPSDQQQQHASERRDQHASATSGPSSQEREHARAISHRTGTPPLGLVPPPTPYVDLHASIEIARCSRFQAKRLFVRWLVCWSLQHWRWRGEPHDEQRPPDGDVPTFLRGATQVVMPCEGADIVEDDRLLFSTCAPLPEVSLRSTEQLDQMPERSFPHLLLAVYWMDRWGRSGVAGYGTVSLGTQCPRGDSEHRVSTWKLVGTGTQTLKERLVGGSNAISDARALISPSFSSMHNTVTQTAGDVVVRVGKKIHERKERARVEQELHAERMRSQWRTTRENGLLPKSERRGLMAAKSAPRENELQGRQAVGSLSAQQQQRENQKDS